MISILHETYNKGETMQREYAETLQCQSCDQLGICHYDDQRGVGSCAGVGCKCNKGTCDRYRPITTPLASEFQDKNQKQL